MGTWKEVFNQPLLFGIPHAVFAVASVPTGSPSRGGEVAVYGIQHVTL